MAKFSGTKCPPANRLVKASLLGLLLLFCVPAFLCAQVQTSVEIVPTKVVEGDVFQLVMTLQDARPNEVYPEPLEMPEGLRVIETYVERDPENPSSSRYIVRIRALRSGFFELASLRLAAAGHALASGAILIQVQPASGGEIPMEAEWQLSNQNPLAGETVLASLILRSPTAPAFPDAVRFRPPDWGDFKSVEGAGRIDTVEYVTGTVFTVPVLTYLLTASSAGNFTIPSAVVQFEDGRVTAGSFPVSVQPAPQGIAGSGAVGEFRYTVEVEPLEVFQGENVSIRIRIEGEGNLPYIQLPEPRVENLVITGFEDQDRISAAESGFSGVRTRNFRLTTRDTGSYILRLPGISWYSPSEERVISRPSRSVQLTVLPVPLGDNSTGSNDLGLMSAERIEGMPAANHLSFGSLLVWLFPPLLGLLLWRGMGRRSSRAGWIIAAAIMVFISGNDFQVDLDDAAAVEAFSQQDFSRSFELYSSLLATHQELPGLWYNTGIAAYRAGFQVDAIDAFRQAVRLRPDNSQIRSALLWAEKNQGLDAQIPLPPPISSIPLLGGLTAVLSLMGALWFFFKLRQGGILVLFLSSGIVAIVLLLASLSISMKANTRIAVLHEPEGMPYVYRIPAEDVDPWIQLKAGTVVRLLDSSGDFFLIETGPGLQGWVRNTTVLQR